VSVKPTSAGLPALALWNDQAEAVDDATLLPSLVTMKPGYTPSEAWTVWWEGVLPDLSLREAQLQVSLDPLNPGPSWLAIQTSYGLNALGPYRGVARLYDPRLAVHVGDIVVITAQDPAACSPTGSFEVVVTELLPPTPDYPGGAVSVVRRDPAQTCLDDTPAPGRAAVQATFRSGGLLLTGISFGYGGRPEVGDATGPGFSLAWQDPTPLSCPMLDDPTWPPAGCDQACRTSCEQLILSRKARRSFYMAEQCQEADTACAERWKDKVTGKINPLINPVGPVLAFRPTFKYPAGSTSTPPPARGGVMSIITSSGLATVLRQPLVSNQATDAVLPAGMTTFDRSAATRSANDGVRLYTAYPGGLVYDYTPSGAATTGLVYR
jgi:hypothetical protein